MVRKKIRNPFLNILILIFCLFVSGCSTGFHGTFISNTYIDKQSGVEGEVIGNVIGESTQTYFLYLFPMGASPSTDIAINDAKQKIKGTKYLSDVSIDDRMIWGIGYRKQIIKVEAEARN